MKKFLAIGALTLALTGAAAAGITATSVIRADDAADTAQTAVVETAVLRQGSRGGEV